jgi:hypothetical protein
VLRDYQPEHKGYDTHGLFLFELVYLNKLEIVVGSRDPVEVKLWYKGLKANIEAMRIKQRSLVLAATALSSREEQKTQAMADLGPRFFGSFTGGNSSMQSTYPPFFFVSFFYEFCFANNRRVEFYFRMHRPPVHLDGPLYVYIYIYIYMFFSPDSAFSSKMHCSLCLRAFTFFLRSRGNFFFESVFLSTFDIV